jgi:hypothetical protein
VARLVAILDDTAARVVEMRAVLREVLPECEVVAFDNVADFVDWQPGGLGEAVLISLDHDLGPSREPREAGGERFEPGIGRDAADVMALYAPTCPSSSTVPTRWPCRGCCAC